MSVVEIKPKEAVDALNGSIKTIAKDERTFNIGLFLLNLVFCIFCIVYFVNSTRDMRNDYLTQIEKTEARFERVNYRYTEVIEKHTNAINEMMSEFRRK